MAKKQHVQTGPKTISGKQTAAKNSTSHGLCATGQQLLPGEAEAERVAILERWRETYEGYSPGLAVLIEHHALNDRLLQNAQRQLIAAELELGAAIGDRAGEEEIARLEKRLNLVLRYKTTHERSFQRTLRNLEQFEARRTKEDIAERRTIMAECKDIASLTIKGKKNGFKPADIYKALKKYGQEDAEVDGAAEDTPEQPARQQDLTEPTAAPETLDGRRL